jgi:hypothetical protein
MNAIRSMCILAYLASAFALVPYTAVAQEITEMNL